MKSITLIRRMSRLIRHKQTGDCNQFAEKLGISRSSLFYKINFMKKELNAPIYYDRSKNSYCYLNEGEIIISFKTIDENESKEIKGGCIQLIELQNLTLVQPYWTDFSFLSA